jgi:hypothetical protein
MLPTHHQGTRDHSSAALAPSLPTSSPVPGRGLFDARVEDGSGLIDLKRLPSLSTEGLQSIDSVPPHEVAVDVHLARILQTMSGFGARIINSMTRA